MANLQLVIDAINNASTELGNVKTDIEEIGGAATEQTKPVEDLDDSLGNAIMTAGLVVAAVAGVIEAFGLLYDAAKQAAAVDLLNVKLDNLAGSIGTTSEALTTKLGGAAQGISNDLQISTGAIQALSTGLVTSEEGLLRMATASGEAGITFDNFVSLVGNASQSSLTKAGFAVDDFSGQVKALTDTGMTEGAAKFEVAMKAIESTVEKTGNFAETAAGQTQQLETAFSNVGAAGNDALLPIANKVFPAITEGLNGLTTASKVGKLTGDLKDMGISVSNLVQPYKGFLGTLRGLDEVLVTQMATVKGWAQTATEGFMASGMSASEAQAKTADLYNSIGELNTLPMDAKELLVESDELTAAQNLLDILNSTTLEDKDATVTYGVNDSTVRAYIPPTKTSTVRYSVSGLPSYAGGYAVGGPVTAGAQYNWQEYGYRGEVFVPSADGFVLSRADAERALAKALYGGGSAVDPEAIGRAVAQAMSGVTAKGKGGNVYNLTMPTSNNPADIRTAFELMEAWA